MNTLRRVAHAGRQAGANAVMAEPRTVPTRLATADWVRTMSAATRLPLREGSRGTEVRNWQATLNRLADVGMPSQPKIAVDGIFGPRTKTATRIFQRWAHITADGIVGPKTRAMAATTLSSAALALIVA